MIQEAKSIRTFIGAKEYAVARAFYRDLGFEEAVLSEKLSLFRAGGTSFYLQEYYVKDWVDNSMVLLEVENVDQYWQYLQGLALEKKYPGIRLIPVRENDWGKECFVTDPSGVLWHFAEFT